MLGALRRDSRIQSPLSVSGDMVEGWEKDQAAEGVMPGVAGHLGSLLAEAFANHRGRRVEKPGACVERRKRMRKRLSIALSLIVVLSLLMVAPVSADPPMRGTMDLTFNLGAPGSPPAECPDIAWIGTITIDGDVYDMAFFPIGSGKPFDSDPSTSVPFFEEIWTIYELGTFDYEFTTMPDGVDILTTCDDELAVPVLSGHDSGTTSLMASRYRMKGEVDYAAGPFAGLEGRQVHMGGTVEWYPFGAPHFAPGDFRLK